MALHCLRSGLTNPCPFRFGDWSSGLGFETQAYISQHIPIYAYIPPWNHPHILLIYPQIPIIYLHRTPVGPKSSLTKGSFKDRLHWMETLLKMLGPFIAQKYHNQNYEKIHHMGFPKVGATFWGAKIIRTTIFWGLNPPIGETTIYPGVERSLLLDGGKDQSANCNPKAQIPARAS